MSRGTPEADALATFIAARRRVPFSASPLGCGALVRDWLEASGIDVLIKFPNAERGSAPLEILAIGWAARIGLKLTREPGRGDVGVIAGRPDVLGICLGSGWVFQGEKGVALVTRPLIRQAWSCDGSRAAAHTARPITQGAVAPPIRHGADEKPSTPPQTSPARTSRNDRGRPNARQ